MGSSSRCFQTNRLSLKMEYFDDQDLCTKKEQIHCNRYTCYFIYYEILSRYKWHKKHRLCLDEYHFFLTTYYTTWHLKLGTCNTSFRYLSESFEKMFLHSLDKMK